MANEDDDIERGHRPVPEGQREHLRRLVDELGEQGAADHIRVTRWTIGRCLAGLPLGTGTRALIALRLQSAPERIATLSARDRGGRR